MLSIVSLKTASHALRSGLAGQSPFLRRIPPRFCLVHILGGRTSHVLLAPASHFISFGQQEMGTPSSIANPVPELKYTKKFTSF